MGVRFSVSSASKKQNISTDDSAVKRERQLGLKSLPVKINKRARRNFKLTAACAHSIRKLQTSLIG